MTKSNREIENAKAKSTRVQNICKINKFFPKYINAITDLNRIYYVTKLSKDLVIQARESIKRDEEPKISIEIPNIFGDEFQKEHKKGDITNLLKSAIRYDIFSNAIVSSVTITEYFFESILKYIFQKYPQKLLISMKGSMISEKDKVVPLKSVLSADSLEELIEEEVNHKLLQLMYAKPNDYFEFLEKGLSLKLKDDCKDSFIEIKATRDLIIHNGGKVNKIYIEKSGPKCRVTDIRQNIPLGNEYLLNAFGTMKQLVKETYIKASKVYLKQARMRDLFP